MQQCGMNDLTLFLRKCTSRTACRPAMHNLVCTYFLRVLSCCISLSRSFPLSLNLMLKAENREVFCVLNTKAHVNGHVDPTGYGFFEPTLNFLCSLCRHSTGTEISLLQITSRFPDFKRKQTGEALWLVDSRNPPWVQAELALLPPGTLQPNALAWFQRLKRYVKAGQYSKTVEEFRHMHQESINPDIWTFLSVLKACAGLGDLEEGRRIHTQIIQRGCESNVYVANCLINMYGKCGSIEDAWSVFHNMQKHDVVSWNAMIGGYAKSGHGLKAVELFRKMLLERVEPNAITFVGVLNACASVAALEEGRRVHEQLIQGGWDSNVYVANSLVDMYAKCASIEDARDVFNTMQERCVVSWNSMIRGYVKSGCALKAMELFWEMQQAGVEPSPVTFVGVLNACAGVAALEEGRHVHEQIIRRRCEKDVYVANGLVDMYAKCGSVADAWSVFNKMPQHNVVSWGVMIGGYVKSGQGVKAMELFRKMQLEGVEPDAVSFVGALNACASVAALEEGRQIHEQIIQRGFQSNVYVATCLVDMYAKCGIIEDAWSVFKKMPEHNAVAWDAMIRGYTNSGQALKAMELFWKMQQEGVEPDVITFVGVLDACASVAALEEGRRVHESILAKGWESDVHVANSLVDMYARCKSIEDAWSVFNKMGEHDVVSWNAMIGFYVKSEEGLKAIELFQKMQQEEVEPNKFTLVGVLNGCANVAALGEGRKMHDQIIRNGCESDVYVANGLLDMYAKCGSMEDAWSVFKEMPDRDVISWSVMIGGYVKYGQGLKAMELFREMQQEGVEPNTVTFVGVLNACTSVMAFEEGRCVHEQIIQSGCESDVYVATCLVNMYAKSGSIEDAWTVFNKIREHNVISWSAMIGAYAKHGHAKKAIQLFKLMDSEGCETNEITFTCLLSACSHAGLVKEGLRYFKSMTSCYNICPTVEHYACMVDLLGRADWLDEAEDMAKRMPAEKNAAVWRSLLGACRIHGNIEMAERAARRCWELDPEIASGLVLLSNIYAAGGKWDTSTALEEEKSQVVLVSR